MRTRSWRIWNAKKFNEITDSHFYVAVGSSTSVHYSYTFSASESELIPLGTTCIDEDDSNGMIIIFYGEKSLDNVYD